MTSISDTKPVGVKEKLSAGSLSEGAGVAWVVVWLVGSGAAMGFAGASWELLGCMMDSVGTMMVSWVSWVSLSSGSMVTSSRE